MKKSEFEKSVKELGLEKVVESEVFESKNNVSYYIDEKRNDVYGLYQDKNNKYIVFYKSLERHISKSIGEFDTEELAFDELLKDLKGSVNVKI